MSDKVVPFPGTTLHDIDPDKVLQAAIGNLEGVVIAGFDKDGKGYFASSYGSGGDTLWLLEVCKRALVEKAVRDE